MSSQPAAPGEDQEQPFLSHLLELRDRLLRVVLAVLLIFLGLFPFANEIYTFIAGPLMAHLPEGSQMIAIEVASPFLTPFKLTMVASIFLAMPVILHQMWAFVAPGLYRHERRLALPILVSSIFLFYLGMAFAYFVVFPLVFGFFTSVTPEGVAMMTDINKYLDFVLTIFFAFGLAFEVPIATVIAVWSGITTPARLARMRPYIIVAAFVIGMLLTPPDVISQTLLAIPMWALFEVGLLFSRFYQRKTEGEEEEEDEEEEEERTIHPAAATAAATGEAEHEPEVFTPPSDYRPLTDEEMEEELDRIEEEENFYDDDDETGDGSRKDDTDDTDDGAPPPQEK